MPCLSYFDLGSKLMKPTNVRQRVKFIQYQVLGGWFSNSSFLSGRRQTFIKILKYYAHSKPQDYWHLEFPFYVFLNKDLLRGHKHYPSQLLLVDKI